MNFPKIGSLNAVFDHDSPPLALQEDEWGMVMLDLDQTLIQARPTLGDEHFYKFLVRLNEADGVDSDLHYHWVADVRKQVPYESCETSDKVMEFINRFRQNNWTVKVLTSRGLDMREATAAQLAQAKIGLTVEDVIFKRPNQEGKLMDKDDSLIDWMQTQGPWTEAKKIKVFFLDDNTKYCQHVARVKDKVSRASVACYHYIGAEPRDVLQPAQLEQLVVQLYAYSRSEPIPYQHDAAQVQAAMAGLKMKEIEEGAVYKKIREFI